MTSFSFSPLHHRHPADIISQHARDSVVQGFIGISDAQVGRAGLADGDRIIARTIKGAHDLTAGDDPGQLPFFLRQQGGLAGS